MSVKKDTSFEAVFKNLKNRSGREFDFLPPEISQILIDNMRVKDSLKNDINTVSLQYEKAAR